jgi:uncharacterized membrane protein
MTRAREWIEIAALGIEILAVAVMSAVILVSTLQWLLRLARRLPNDYQAYREGVARAMLVGLELLVAADIIRTVVVEPTLGNMAILASLVLIRSFLGWSLTLEIEGRWPWQKAMDNDRESTG